jgi:signal peptidase I
MDMNVFYAKRCVAIPGDTFFIENEIYKVKNANDRLGNYERQQQLSKLPLDTLNIALYKNLIIYETGKNISVNQDRILLNNSLITAYTFQQNYYFMAGDYVADSRDSRYWGLLPEDHIVGKVALVWQSIDKNTGKRR